MSRHVHPSQPTPRTIRRMENSSRLFLSLQSPLALRQPGKWSHTCEDQSAGRPQTQTLPSDGTPPSTLSADQFAMGATQHNHKLETSDANPPVRVQASAYGRPSATPDDSHNNKLPTDWREAIDRAMRSNHVQDTPVLHATAAASTVPISGDRAGPERFPYVEAESEAAPQQAVVPEKSAAYVAPGKWAGQEMRTAEVCTVHSTPHFDAVHIILPTNGTDVHFPCLFNRKRRPAQPYQRKQQVEPDATRVAFGADEMRQVQPSKHEPSHQAPLASSNEVSSIPASSRNARPEPRREDSSNRQSSVPGQAPRSRSPVPRKRVPIESITANIQVDAPKSELYLGAQGQGAFGASQETVMKHVGRYPEHAETQRQVPHGSLQDFFGNSRQKLAC